jgi:hypothetical protein
MRKTIALTLAAAVLTVPTWIAHPATETAKSLTAQFFPRAQGGDIWNGVESYPLGDKGSFQAYWDGSALILKIKAKVTSDAAASFNFRSGTDYPRDTDFIAVGFDVFGDRFNFETDTAGWFMVFGDGTLKTFSNAMIPSLSSPWNPNSPEYADRIAVDADVAGDTREYQICLQLDAIGREYVSDGDTCAIEIAIHDGATDDWAYWSHTDDTLYIVPDHERARAVDWGLVTFAGSDGSWTHSWRADEAIRWYNSKSNPGDNVWRADTLKVFKDAMSAYSSADNMSSAVIDNVWDAYKNLRWADTKYPDPLDLPRLNTLPNPYKFFNSDREVATEIGRAHV